MSREHPWEGISLSDYESHMSLASVNQLQTLNSIMKEQLCAYPTESAVILGIAGGNGLEHVSTEKYRRIYGVDINRSYLTASKERYPQLSGVLQCLRLDLSREAEKLPRAQLLIADLLVEYIGFEAFQRAVLSVEPEYVSCVIQINTDVKNWVSDSPYLHAFDGLDRVHHQIGAGTLSAAMDKIGYTEILSASHPLPDGKALVRMDHRRMGPHTV
ncbi:MAG: methyltransferase type 11 [Ruminococcus sp.]|nr:methyltransferase type 11 [Ruminococcus sp.]